MSKDLMKYNATRTWGLKEIDPTKEEWKEIAESLWKLLDDIDTAGDMFKPEITPYFRYVTQKAQDRDKYIGSDGYRLKPYGKEGKLWQPKD